jgi:hypothetical protein
MQNSWNVTHHTSSTGSNSSSLEIPYASASETQLGSLTTIPLTPVKNRRESVSSMRLPSLSNETLRSVNSPTSNTSRFFRMSHKQQLALCSLFSAATTSVLHFKLGAMYNSNRSWPEPKANANETSLIPELDAPALDAPVLDAPEGMEPSCALPTRFGGWHSGKFIATLQKENGWTWQECASECAKLDACVSWTLPVHDHNTACNLLAEKGEYHESGYHVEGERDVNCLNPKAPIAGQEIKKIFYINLEKNKLRRQSMEEQLSKQAIPFQRINALAGNQSHACSGDIGAPGEGKCRGVAGLALSNIAIIDHEDHSQGFSLVLEDDVQVQNMEILMSSISSVPKDWDIIRWNCIPEEYIPATFDRINRYVFRTYHQTHCEPTRENAWCNFYGGTYAMLWRNEGLSKLREVWSQEPFTDIDGRLNTEKLKSYCVDVGTQVMHKPPQQEMSDIQINDSGNITIQWN